MKNIISILFLMLSFMSTAQSQSITATYRYDDLHRLDRATYSNGIIITYSYDALGNRTSYVVTGACALATPSVSKQDATCGNTNGSLTVTATGNGLQYSKDGTTFQPSNVFNNLAAGTYTITVKDAANCTATAAPITIQNAGSTLSITSVTPQSATCGNANGRLTVVAVGSGLQYSKDGINFQPSNVFNNLAVGNYTITVKDATNCTTTSTSQRIENTGLPPVASFTNVANNLNVVFSNTSTNTTGATYSWNFGDNTPLSTQANPTHNYTQGGSFTVTLTITTACGTHTTTRNITVSQACLPPVASFTNVANNLNVIFSNTSTNTTGATYSWNFGDNTPLSTEANPTHLYAQGGSFTVTLTITTACGTNTTTRNVTVSQGCLPPFAGFTNAVNNLNVVFSNTSTNTIGATYSWNFGDNTPLSIEANPAHLYTQSGTFTVTLTITTACGTNTTTRNITVSQGGGSNIPTTIVNRDRVILNFSQSLGTVSANNIRVWGIETGLKTGATSVNGASLTFTPTTPFKAGEQIDITVKGVLSATGTAIPNFVSRKITPVTNPTTAVFDTLSTPRFSSVENETGDIHLADLDKNGLDDIIYRHDGNGNATKIDVYLQTASRTFAAPVTYQSSSSYSGLRTTADFNNDGYPDLLISHNVPSQVMVWLNNGSGGFTTPTAYNVSVYCNNATYADFDGDGDLDIVAISGYSVIPSNYIDILVNDGTGRFTQGQRFQYAAFGGIGGIGDWDNDGDMDVIVSTASAFGSTRKVLIYKNDGLGNLSLGTDSGVLSTDESAMLVNDYNSDGKIDFLTGSSQNGTRLFLGNGNSSVFPTNPRTVSTQQFQGIAGDIDGNGTIDILEFNRYNGTSWHHIGQGKRLNDGNGNFTLVNDARAFTSRSWIERFGDMDNDGDLDYPYVSGEGRICVAYNGGLNLCAAFTGVNSTVVNTTCRLSNGSISAIQPTTGTAPYQYALGSGVFQNSKVFNNLAAGTYTIRVKDANGCEAQTTRDLTNQGEVVNLTISGNTTACKGDTILLSVASGFNTYAWSNGQTTAFTKVTETGNYSVTAINASGCFGNTAISVTFNPRPKADFGFNVQGGKSQFLSLSIDTNNTTVYRWDLGNGTTSNLKNPIGNYTTNGVYTICLWLTNGTGCKDSICKPINVTRVSVPDINKGFKMSIYPNPTQSHFTLELADNIRLNNAKVTIFNIIGQAISQQNFSGQKMLLDLSNQPQGTYFVKLKTENGLEVTRKIQKL